MSELITKVLEVPIPFNFLIVALLLCTVVGIIGVIVMEVRKFATHRLDLDMKREMLDRGMPPEEIEQVLRAGRESTGAKKR